MECQVREGVVLLVSNYPNKQELLVELEGKTASAISFPSLTGFCEKEDRVLLNTTACALNLGTGGLHFVMGVLGKTKELRTPGHIMKLRYTPLQGKVWSVEEETSPYHHLFQEDRNLCGMPVLVGSLHSMLAPMVIALQHVTPKARIVYLMSDGASLPLALSKTVDSLRALGLLHSTITFGHAFGGDYEAVNVYTALLTARYVCKADVAILLMGPGVVGTNTPWGTTALEQGVYLDAVNLLQGRGIGVLRLSSAEKRKRHQGISHHTLTCLTKITQRPCFIAFPTEYAAFLQGQLCLFVKHKVQGIEVTPYLSCLKDSPVPLESMGRTYTLDPLFFLGPFSAGLLASSFLLSETN